MLDRRQMLKGFASLVVFVLLAGSWLPLAAAAAPTVYDFRLVQGTAALPAVKLYADVIGAGDVPAKGLQPSAMKATVGPVEAKVLRVTPFEDAKEGIGFVLMVDISKSLSQAQFATMKETLAAFIGSMSELDRVALVTFGNQVKPVQDFTANRARIQELIDALELTDDETAFYSGIDKAIAMARAGGNDVPRRRVVISLTDGVNELTGGATKGDIAERLVVDAVPVYLIGFFQGQTSLVEESAIGVMKNFSQLSGGRYYDGRGGDWRGIYFAISRAIRSAFVIELEVPNFRSEGAVYPVSVMLTAANRTWTEKLKLTIPTGGVVAPITTKDLAAPGADANKTKQAEGVKTRRIWLFAGLGAVVLLGLGWLILRRRPAKTVVLESAQNSPGRQVAGLSEIPVAVVASAGVLLRLTRVHEGPLPSQFEIEIVDRVVLGSDPAVSHLVFEPESGLDPAHCEICFEAGIISIRDLGSSGGTYLNGVRLVGPRQIEGQDILAIGDIELKITFPV